MLRIAGRLIARATGREATGVEARLRGGLLALPRAGKRLRVGPRVELVGDLDNLRLGDDVSFLGNSYVNFAGTRGWLRVGSGTHVDQFAVLYAQGGLEIGARCAIAAGFIVYTQSNQYASDPEGEILDQPVLYAPVRIGDDVWIGARAVVLPGVTVGDHAVIAAGSVVRSDIPSWSVVAGVPARVIRDRREKSPSRPG